MTFIIFLLSFSGELVGCSKGPFSDDTEKESEKWIIESCYTGIRTVYSTGTTSTGK